MNVSDLFEHGIRLIRQLHNTNMQQMRGAMKQNILTSDIYSNGFINMDITLVLKLFQVLVSLQFMVNLVLASLLKHSVKWSKWDQILWILESFGFFENPGWNDVKSIKQIPNILRNLRITKEIMNASIKGIQWKLISIC